MHLLDLFRYTRTGKSRAQSLFAGLTDYHTHLLPGVDDGVETIEESLRCLEAHERLGFEEVWLTPHIMEDIPNTTDRLRTIFERLRQAYTGPIRLRLAAEYMIDPLLSERLEADDLLTIDDHLLVETSYFDAPKHLRALLARIAEKGYTPLLAHPERYNYMSEPDYHQLKGQGVRFQLNLLSLTGLYGPHAKAKAEKLCAERLYDRIGSDQHTPRQSEALERMARTAAFVRPISSLNIHSHLTIE